MEPLDHLIEQLWAPVLRDGTVRLLADPPPDPSWLDIETYWAIPDIRHLKMLVPASTRAVASGAAGYYRGLRRPLANALRAVGSRWAGVGLPLSRQRIVLQARKGCPDATRQLPLRMLSDTLGAPLVASIGVRTGDNRKATMALWTPDGLPAGFAKVGWNKVTDGYVRTERQFLRHFGGADGAVRAPALLADLDYHGHPLIVTEALPTDVVGGLNKRVADPTSQEMYFLTPVQRKAPPIGTLHFNQLVSRLADCCSDRLAASVAGPANRLAAMVRNIDQLMPVTARWHGDFTPWNRARQSSGQLWVWDWENCESDVIAGLDPLHWAFSVRRMEGGHRHPRALVHCLSDASHHLVAAGVNRELWGVVAAVYALVITERACTLAVHHRSWKSIWISRDTLGNLLSEATVLIQKSR